MARNRSRQRRKRKRRQLKNRLGVRNLNKKQAEEQNSGGNGAHQEVSPMGHATRTKTKHEIKAQLDRKQKQQGYDSD